MLHEGDPMSKATRPLTSLPHSIATHALILLIASVVGCAEIQPDPAEDSSWVPATAEVEQSLGVSEWFVEALDGGVTRVVGYDRSDIQLSELRISSPLVNQMQTLTYDLHVTRHTRLVLTETAMIEDTLSDEPRGQEWFDVMVNVPSLVKTSSAVDKSIGSCVGQEAGMEIVSVICDLAGGGHGSPHDYAAICSAIWRCLAYDSNDGSSYDTQIASNNTGSTGDTWSSYDNANSGCYDSWGNPSPCQGDHQSDYQSDYQSGYYGSQDNVCYDSWGYQIPCDTW